LTRANFLAHRRLARRHGVAADLERLAPELLETDLQVPLELGDPTPLIGRERLIVDESAVDEDVAVLEHLDRRGAARLRLAAHLVARLEAPEHRPEIGQ
jgi:hypothetical protein